MYCTLTCQVTSLATIRNALAVSIPTHFEFDFPRWDAFRSGNAISSFCRTNHCHFATPQSQHSFDTCICYSYTNESVNLESLPVSLYISRLTLVIQALNILSSCYDLLYHRWVFFTQGCKYQVYTINLRANAGKE